MKKVLLSIALLITITVGVAWWIYNSVMSINTQKGELSNIVSIPSDANWAQVIDSLTLGGILIDKESLLLTAKLMKFGDADVRSGRYEIPAAISSRRLINLLRSGRQAAVPLVINNVRTLQDLAGNISKYIEIDSTAIIEAMLDSAVLQTQGLDAANALTMYIPNTYEVYWNTTADKLVQRMQTEWEKWWDNEDRRSKALALGMTPAEVYTLASIVDKESNLKAEKPTIAGVYLNRLQRGIALQADPTVVFASKQYDLRRVLNRHLAIDSPYNTYMYTGLPPGPIYMASIDGLEAVLNAEQHSYIYFCAAPGFGSKHVFASTLKQHNRNARTFHRWLNQQGIK